jgi:hypothetical protein
MAAGAVLRLERSREEAPYASEEARFANGDVTLAGSLLQTQGTRRATSRRSAAASGAGSPLVVSGTDRAKSTRTRRQAAGMPSIPAGGQPSNYVRARTPSCAPCSANG